MTKTEKENFIVRGDKFDYKFASYTQEEAGKKISEFLNKKRVTISETDHSYRAINYWEDTGLIDNDRTNEGGWRKFSIMDLFWIQIISELKDFGFSTEKIQEVKKSLFGKEYNRFLSEFYVYLSLLRKEDCIILIFQDGKAELATKEELEFSNTLKTLNKNFIHINFNLILQKIFTSKKIPNVYNLRFDLDQKEISTLLDIRDGQFEEINIKTDNGEIVKINKTEKVKDLENVFEQVRKIIKDGNYQSINLEQQDGKIISLKRTIKEKK